MTLCNMVVEAGGKNGVVPADSTTYKYLEASRPTYNLPVQLTETSLTPEFSSLHQRVVRIHIHCVGMQGRYIYFLINSLFYKYFYFCFHRIRHLCPLSHFTVMNKQGNLGYSGTFCAPFSLVLFVIIPLSSLCLAFISTFISITA